MKKLKTILLMFLVMVLWVTTVVPVCADSYTQDGIEVTINTDKQKYDTDEKITATVTVKNTNNWAVTDVSVECVFPDGYCAESSGALTVPVLEGYGNFKAHSVVLVPKMGNAPDTADTNHAEIWSILLIVTVIVMTGVCILYRKKGSRMFCLLICLAMVLSSFPMNAMEVQAADDSYTACAFQTVEVGSKKLVIEGKVTYTIPGSENEEETESPAPSETESPVPEETESPAPSETESPVLKEIESPAPSETESPVTKETESPAPSETESPVPKETESPAPSETESSTPSETESPAPSETESPAPEENESPVPSETESPAPSETESPTPSETESPAPSETESPTPTPTSTPTPTPAPVQMLIPVEMYGGVNTITLKYEEDVTADSNIGTIALADESGRAVALTPYYNGKILTLKTEKSLTIDDTKYILTINDKKYAFELKTAWKLEVGNDGNVSNVIEYGAGDKERLLASVKENGVIQENQAVLKGEHSVFSPDYDQTKHENLSMVMDIIPLGWNYKFSIVFNRDSQTKLYAEGYPNGIKWSGAFWVTRNQGTPAFLTRRWSIYDSSNTANKTLGGYDPVVGPKYPLNVTVNDIRNTDVTVTSELTQSKGVLTKGSATLSAAPTKIHNYVVDKMGTIGTISVDNSLVDVWDTELDYVAYNKEKDPDLTVPKSGYMVFQSDSGLVLIRNWKLVTAEIQEYAEEESTSLVPVEMYGGVNTITLKYAEAVTTESDIGTITLTDGNGAAVALTPYFNDKILTLKTEKPLSAGNSAYILTLNGQEYIYELKTLWELEVGDDGNVTNVIEYGASDKKRLLASVKENDVIQENQALLLGEHSVFSPDYDQTKHKNLSMVMDIAPIGKNYQFSIVFNRDSQTKLYAEGYTKGIKWSGAFWATRNQGTPAFLTRRWSIYDSSNTANKTLGGYDPAVGPKYPLTLGISDIMNDVTVTTEKETVKGVLTKGSANLSKTPENIYSYVVDKMGTVGTISVNNTLVDVWDRELDYAAYNAEKDPDLTTPETGYMTFHTDRNYALVKNWKLISSEIRKYQAGDLKVVSVEITEGEKDCFNIVFSADMEAAENVKDYIKVLVGGTNVDYTYTIDKDTITVVPGSFAPDVKYELQVLKDLGYDGMSIKEADSFTGEYTFAEKDGETRITAAKVGAQTITYKDDTVFANGHLSFDLSPGESTVFGVLFRVVDESNYYTLKFDYTKNKIELVRKDNTGAENVVETAEVILDSNQTTNIDLGLLGRNFVIMANDTKCIEYTDEYLSQGHIGFYAVEGRADVTNIKFYENPDDIYASYPHTEIYVAVDGSNETGDGSYEKPYATIECARDQVAGTSLVKAPVDIILKEGDYRIIKNIVFTTAHSGSATMPITYKAEEGKEVVLNGSTRLSANAFNVVTDPTILNRLHEEVRGKVYQIDLAAQGIKRENIDWVSGFDEPNEVGQVAKTVQIFVNDRPQTLSRWPNDSFAVIEDCVRGSISTSDSTGGQLKFTNAEPLRWTQAKDMYIGGRMYYEWYEEWIPVNTVDTDNMIIHMKTNSQYGLRAGHEWSAYNLLEEIDMPGEWYIDMDTMMLYIYPEKEYTADDIIEITTLNDSMISVKGAQYINFEGLTFAKSAGMLKKLPNGKGYNEGNAIDFGDVTKNMTIKDCTFRDVGGYGVVNIPYNSGAANPYLSNMNITVAGCDFIRCREFGIFLTGGNRETMEDSSITVSNNFFYGTGARASGYHSGNGFTFVNNLISHTSTKGITSSGSEVRIKNNELSFCTYEQSDMGAIYFGRNLAEDGTEIVNNYVHHYGIDIEGKDFSNGAVYLDDVAGGITIRNNIFVARSKNTVSTGIIYGGGPDVVIEGNISIGARIGYIIQNRVGSSPGYLTDNAYALDKALPALRSAAYIAKYPKAARHLALVDGNYKAYDSQTTYINNIAYDCTEADRKTNMALEPILTGNIGDAIVLTGDVFVDPDNHDYRIKDSVASANNLPDVLAAANFNLNAIGPQRTVELNQSLLNFEITSPRQGEQTRFANYVTLGWQVSDVADEYYYEVAKDAGFTDIVLEGKTYLNGVTVNNLEAGTTYYFRVKAVSYMSEYGYANYNSNGVICFTTSSQKYIVTSLLDAKIQALEGILENMDEGPNAGQYQVGTKARIEAIITNAEVVKADANVTQAKIDACTEEILKAISTLDGYKNLGYSTFNFAADAVWNIKGTASAEISANHAKFVAEKASTVSLEQILSNYEILCFKFKVSNWTTSYMTFGMRYQDPALFHYSDNSNYILFKKDIVEIQKKGKVFDTFTNENFIQNDVWHEAKIGAITTDAGVNFIFEIDGKIICDYLDTSENAQYNPGRFAMIVPAGVTMEVAASENVPTGLYQISDEIKEQIQYGKPILWDTTSEGFEILAGTWTETENKPEGYAEIAASDAGAKVQLMMIGEGTMTYRVSYYHNPSSENDNNVKIILTGKDGEYETTVDMTAGEAGYVDLGTFKFVSDNAAVGKTAIQFIGSGNGKVPVSSIKMQKVDKELYPDMLTQNQ